MIAGDALTCIFINCFHPFPPEPTGVLSLCIPEIYPSLLSLPIPSRLTLYVEIYDALFQSVSFKLEFGLLYGGLICHKC